MTRLSILSLVTAVSLITACSSTTAPLAVTSSHDTGLATHGPSCTLSTVAGTVAITNGTFGVNVNAHYAVCPATWPATSYSYTDVYGKVWTYTVKWD